MRSANPEARDRSEPGFRTTRLRFLLAGILLTLHALYAIGDRTWWGEFVAVWPPIGWLAVFLPAIVRWRDAVSLTLLLLLVGLHGEWPRLRTVPEARGSLRVVSWNVAGDRTAWTHVRAFDPDLVLVQEHAGPPSPPWPGFVWRAGADGATLSRSPADVLPTRRIGPWTEPLVVAVTLPDGRRLVAANVRLVLPSVVVWAAAGLRGSPSAIHEARVGQFSALARLLDESRARTGAQHVLLCGDFNSPGTLPSLAPLRGRLVDSWTAAGSGWPGTAPAILPLARIDQCWTSPDLPVLAVRAHRMPTSDHRLLLVDYGPARSPAPGAPQR